MVRGSATAFSILVYTESMQSSGFFLRKEPHDCMDSVNTRIENAVDKQLSDSLGPKQFAVLGLSFLLKINLGVTRAGYKSTTTVATESGGRSTISFPFGVVENVAIVTVPEE